MEDPVPDTSDVPTEVRVQFWGLVFTIKVAILGLAIGSMVLYFTDRTTLGAAMVVAGALFAIRGYRRLQRVRGDDE